MASAAEVDAARDFVKLLTVELVALGATFVLPVDRENVRPADGRPICFDWLIWETLDANQFRRPGAAPEPLAIAVQHHKTEAQIPPQYEAMWDPPKGFQELVAFTRARGSSKLFVADLF